MFGDGLIEAARHFWIGHLALYLFLGGLLVALADLRNWPQYRWSNAIIIGVATAILIALLLSAGRWMREQPLAYGILDHPQGNTVSAGGMTLSGWAIDPSGVDEVQVIIGEKVFRARYGERATENVAAMYPGYPDAERSSFDL